MYYKGVIDEKTCKKIIALGLSKMVVDEGRGISKKALTFDGKEKGGVDSKGKKTSTKLSTGGANKITLKKKGIDVSKAYVRDSHISWLNEKWIYENILFNLPVTKILLPIFLIIFVIVNIIKCVRYTCNLIFFVN